MGSLLHVLYPEEQIKPHIKAHNATEAIYSQLNQKQQAADITEVIMRLQNEVDDSVELIATTKNDNDFVDLAKLDMEKLRKAFLKSQVQNTIVFDLQEAIENKLERMVKENPIRLEFYDKYKAIIEAYNKGKDQLTVQATFDELTDFIAELSEEEGRALREGLDQETLAIFDLLKKPDLSKKDEAAVKEVAMKTLAELKAEKLRIAKWRESTQIAAQVKTIIFDALQFLPQDAYANDEVAEKSSVVYQHIYATYNGTESALYA
jgi:type I restriction enzyme, R subunit